jgi:hypothetical protein
MRGHVPKLKALSHCLLALVLGRVLWLSQVLIASLTNVYITSFSAASVYRFGILESKHLLLTGCQKQLGHSELQDYPPFAPLTSLNQF